MWNRKRGRERINESNTDNVIRAFFYSSSCYIISTVLTSCQGLWLLDYCVHFPTGPILKGFYSAITPYSYLGSTDTHMHITHTDKDTHALTQIHRFVRTALRLHTHCSHSHMHMFTSTLTARKTLKVPRMRVRVQVYT